MMEGTNQEFPVQPHNAEARLVKENPLPSTRLTIVVPVYAEYTNGNIFRLIESLNKQKAPSEAYDVLFLVNNTPEAAQNRAEEFHENQQTLALERYLKKEGPAPEGLNEYRQSVLDQAREKNIQMHFVDLSTNGYEKNIGKIRDLGLTEAINRFESNKQEEEGIIAQLDADTVLETKYVEKILNHFKNPDIESLFVNLDYIAPEGSEELFRTSFHHQYNIAFRQWKNTIYNASVTVGGPQTIAKVKAYKQVGGIKHQSMAEDFELSQDLSQQTHYEFATDIRVYTSDRGRPGGYDATMRLENLKVGHYGLEDTMFYVRPNISMLKKELRNALSEHPEQFTNSQAFAPYFEKYHIPFNLEKFEEIIIHTTHTQKNTKSYPLSQKIELYMGNYCTAMNVEEDLNSSDYVAEALAIMQEQLSPEEIKRLNELVRENLTRAKIRMGVSANAIASALSMVYKRGPLTPEDLASNPKQTEFFQRNPWLIDTLNSLRNTYTTEVDATLHLQTLYPEYIGKFENSRLRKSTAILQGLTSFLREARNVPEKFPSANDFLRRMEWITG